MLDNPLFCPREPRVGDFAVKVQRKRRDGSETEFFKQTEREYE